MKRFARLYSAIDSTTSTNRKVEAMVEYFDDHDSHLASDTSGADDDGVPAEVGDLHGHHHGQHGERAPDEALGAAQHDHVQRAAASAQLAETVDDVGQSLNNLGNLYRDEGAYDKAEQFYTRALSIREKALGPEHPDVVSTLSHIALMYMARGDFVKAESYQARAIAIASLT